MSANTLAVTDETFEGNVLKSARPVLVDFWAGWCAPCRAVAPAIEELAGEFAGRLTIAKMDVDQNPVSPGTYGVHAIPTMILFKNGKPAAKQVGALSKNRLKAWLEQSL